MTRTRTSGPFPTRAMKVSPSTTRTTDAENAAAGICGDSTGPGAMTGGAETPSPDPHATGMVTTRASTARTAAARRMGAIVAAAAVTFVSGEQSVDGLQGDLGLGDRTLRRVHLRVRLCPGRERPQRPRPGPGEEAESAGRRGHDLCGELAGGVEQPHVGATLRLAVTSDGPLDDGFRRHVDPLQ